MNAKHLRGRDVPHPERKRARVTRSDGTSFPANVVGEEPRRPAIGMIFEDLGDLSAEERGKPTRPAGDFDRTRDPKRPAFMALYGGPR